MAQAPTTYRWDDPGAPQAGNCTYSELVNIIDKCLVTGYGNKSPLGWIKELNDPLACSYKNLGSGHSVVFSSSSGVNDNKGVSLQSVRNVIDADTLDNAGFKQSFRLFKDRNVMWMLIGTQRAFYFFSFNGGTYGAHVNSHETGFFVGDLSNALNNDQGKFIAISSFIEQDETKVNDTEKSGYGSSLMYINNVTNNRFVGTKIFDADGSTESSLYIPNSIINQPVYAASETRSIPSNLLNGFFLYNYQYSSGLDRDGKSIASSFTRPAVRGSFPGFKYAMIGHQNDITWPFFINYGDKHLILKPLLDAPSRLLLNVEEWDD